MAEYNLADIAKRGLWTQEDINSSAEMVRLFQSGIIRKDKNIANKVESSDAGDLITIPFIQESDYSEPNISDDTTTLAPIESISKDKFLALLGNYNKAYGAYRIARMLDSGNDAFIVMQSLIGRYWAKDINNRMVATSIGIQASNEANNGGDLILDKSAEEWNYDFVVDTNALRGDIGFKGFDFMFMHSKAYASLKKNDAGRVRAILDANTNELMYNLYDEKAIIIIDDLMPLDGDVATVLFGDSGAFIFEDSNDVIEPLEFIPNGLIGNGGGSDIVVTRKRYLLTVNGYSFTSANLAKSTGVTLTELKDGANWERKIKAKQSPISFLKFKTS